ncbi:MAG: helix-turn-helix transcriptional regulator [Fibrobacter sp.]|nr:helix-turn-helix transcriptional regulator [Fibrobacter sp.]
MTSRQKEILSLLRKGLTNSEICFALNISANTVKVHLANIYRILEVTNRTEAVSTDLTSSMDSEGREEVTLTICQGDDFLDSPLPHALYLSIVQALQGCGVFQIKVTQPDDGDRQGDYRINVSTMQGDNQTLFIALHKKEGDTLLWSNLPKVCNSEDISLLTEQISIQLLRQMVLAAAESFEENPSVAPQWWYASCFAISKMENREKNEFDRCARVQHSLLENERHGDFIAGVLAIAYHVAATEKWVDEKECIDNLGIVINETMRKNPSSVYSLYSIALFNMLLGNHKEALNYFELMMHANSPLRAICRRQVSQLYTLTGQGDKARQQIEEYDRCIPAAMYQPFHFVEKAFHHFTLGEYGECQKVAEQLLICHPEIIYPRLLSIACNYRDRNFDQYRKQCRILFEYHPHFSKDDLKHFINCFSPAHRGKISECLKNLFE